ncbi:MAG: sigma-E processing peptidase SpoIIGA [Clostridia bacterium]|nr:sigma-E processing peptidase SpoIIGA [Clostridia bacterium]
MEPTVYLDEYFLVNFSLDAFSLWLAALVGGVRCKAGRTAVSASLGALYAALLLLFPLPLWAEYLTATAAVFCMTRVAFAAKRIHSLFRLSFLVSCASFLTGGIFTVLYRLAAGVFPRLSFARFAPFLFLCGCGAAALLPRCFARFSADAAREVTVVWKGKTLTLRGLTDSGNLLREPVSGASVLFLCADAAKRLFGEEAALLSGEESALAARPPAGLRIACCVTAAGRSAVFLARPDKITVGKGRALEEKNYYIAVLKSETALPEGIDCLLPAR